VDIYHHDGLVSAVAHRDKLNLLLVRANEAEYLRAIFPTEADIYQMANADYKYRVTVSRDEFKAIMLQQHDGITYDNFKNSIPDHQYHDACAGVWSVMRNLQPGKSYPQDLPKLHNIPPRDRRE
jgi:hypothetical protein